MHDVLFIAVHDMPTSPPLMSHVPVRQSAVGSHPEWLHTMAPHSPQVPDVLYNNMASLSQSAP